MIGRARKVLPLLVGVLLCGPATDAAAFFGAGGPASFDNGRHAAFVQAAALDKLGQRELLVFAKTGDGGGHGAARVRGIGTFFQLTDLLAPRQKGRYNNPRFFFSANFVVSHDNITLPTRPTLLC